MSLYLIWSHEHGAWWRGGEMGYVHDVGQAGYFTREHALEICARANQFLPPGAPPNELPVSADDAFAAKVYRTRRGGETS